MPLQQEQEGRMISSMWAASTRGVAAEPRWEASRARRLSRRRPAERGTSSMPAGLIIEQAPRPPPTHRRILRLGRVSSTAAATFLPVLFFSGAASAAGAAAWHSKGPHGR